MNIRHWMTLVILTILTSCTSSNFKPVRSQSYACYQRDGKRVCEYFDDNHEYYDEFQLSPTTIKNLEVPAYLDQ